MNFCDCTPRQQEGRFDRIVEMCYADEVKNISPFFNLMKLFFDSKPLVIGMVHFGPLVGRAHAPTTERLLSKARKDLEILLRGNVPAVMFENMYDQPHTEHLDANRAQQFLTLVQTLTKNLNIPFGFSLLWNDYPHAFHFAKKTGAEWIRVPVFVDDVKTAYGIFKADSQNVLAARKKVGATSVKIFADVQVKHAELVKPRTLTASAKASMKASADALIITGKWTGEPPTLDDVKQVRSVAKRVPLLIGSGMREENLSEYLPLIQGMIVGTSLKAGKTLSRKQHKMRSRWQTPLSIRKVRNFMQKVNMV